MADENVDAHIVRMLRESGHDVWYVAEASSGVSDHEILSRSADEHALLVTADKDFGDLVFRQNKATAGVLLLRLAGLSPEKKASIVKQAVQQYQDELQGAFSVLTKAILRIRKKAGP